MQSKQDFYQQRLGGQVKRDVFGSISLVHYAKHKTGGHSDVMRGSASRILTSSVSASFMIQLTIICRKHVGKYAGVPPVQTSINLP